LRFDLPNILLVLAINALVAMIIAIRQRREGYNFGSTFFKAMIGLIGISAIVWKIFLH